MTWASGVKKTIREKTKICLMERLTLGLGIIRIELMTSTTSRWYSTTELYPFPSLPSSGRKTHWLIITYQRVERLTTTIPLFYFEQLEARPSFHTTTKRKNEKDWILFWVNPIENSIYYFEKSELLLYIFAFKSSDVFPPENEQIPFLRNTHIQDPSLHNRKEKTLCNR